MIPGPYRLWEVLAMYAIQLLLIAVGTGIVAVDIWRWIGRRAPTVQTAGMLDDNGAQNVYNVIFLILGLVVTLMGLIGFLSW
jgi:hypothetical protein